MQELARAKVNLSLHVVGKQADGMHLLDSIVIFPDVGDIIELKGEGFSIGGPFGGGLSLEDNLVLKAAAFFGETPGIHLEKNLPVASGIGGGSADAAAVLRLLAKGEVPDGATLGADIPACVISKPLRMRGIGDQLTRLPALPEFAVVLVNSGAPVSTARVFGALENVHNPPSPPLPAGLDTRGFFQFIVGQRNDMQEAAIGISASISQVLSALAARPDCALARMSGSGGTCFGLFETLPEAEQAAKAIAEAHPQWWVVAARG